MRGSHREPEGVLSNCGYDYKPEDYDDTEAGNEFLTGSELDDRGNEIVDESGRVESERREETDE
jgi:hypothetical protein